MTTFKREDFVNNTEVRWCPGCGDYAILAALQRVLPEIGIAPEKQVFISGIGCAGRLPYYMNTYGFHTIHGRAPAVATGLKGMREDLSVWVITGDGDALSIGGNHFIHCLRRNVDMTILLFNNQVYGLTKGQFSPTSQNGQITKTSPQGLEQQPLNPITLALAAGASFVARAVDKDPQHLASILKAAHAHKGCSFVEIYQDCHIFNNGAFDAFALKNNRLHHTVVLEAGKPLIFGEAEKKALHLDGDKLVVVAEKDALPYCHDPKNIHHAQRLAALHFPEHPVPLGVYYQAERAVFGFEASLQKKTEDLVALYRSKASWKQ